MRRDARAVLRGDGRSGSTSLFRRSPKVAANGKPAFDGPFYSPAPLTACSAGVPH
jgi:hypothetical protein